MKRILALLLALVMVVALCACGPKDPGTASTPGTETTPSAAPTAEPPADDAREPLDLAAVDALLAEGNYDDACWMLYDYWLGDFYELLTAATAETKNLSLRYAMMAQAEAKLDEQALFTITTNDGNRYGISRIIPHSDTSTTWGLDEYRQGYKIFVDQLLTPDERAELLSAWADADTIQDYYAFVKQWIADKGYTQVTSYTAGQTEGPQTWDGIITSLALDHEYIAPTVSPLLRYDGKNQLQPDMAESYEVSEDGMTYTFHIRKGMQWVDQQGRELGHEVTAHDWVTGARHLADFPSELGYMFEPGYANVKNWLEYQSGECSFDEVGVTAVDDYTLQYTLTADTPYFPTMMGYACFAPLNEEYYTSLGGTFGEGATNGQYGDGPNHIAYCGEFLVDDYTEGSQCHYITNEHYWDYENLNLTEFTYAWYDGTDPLAAYNKVKAGEWNGCNLFANSLEQAKKDIVEGTDKSYFDTYAYIGDADTTARQVNFNLLRQTFANFNDESKMVSPQDPAENAARTRVALNNQDFRLALTFALDRGAYNTPVAGEDMKMNSLNNTFVPGDFVQLTEDVELDMGDGTMQTFPAGTFYAEVVQAQFEFDGFEAQAWDPNGNGGAGSSNSFDGWYKPDAAKARLDAAVTALAAQGVEISAENPIYLDLPYWSTNESYDARANIYKQSLESTLGGLVIVNLIAAETTQDWYGTGYYTNTGAENNYDIYDLSGWLPDYQDPTSYLNCYLPDYSGYLTKSAGIF